MPSHSSAALMPLSMSRNSSPMPSDTMMDGMMRLATTMKNSVLPPASRLRNASPASTDNTTVHSITATPRPSERHSAAPMSTTPRPSASLENQCSDTPRMGKVSPPSGPWKLRMKMTNMGPYMNSTNSAKKMARGQKLAGRDSRTFISQLLANVDEACEAPDDHQHHGQQDHGIGRRQRELQVGRLHLDDLANRCDLLPAHHADGHEIAHDDGDHKDRADDDAGARERHDHVPQRLPATRATVAGRLDEAAVDAHHAVEDGHDHEHGVQVHKGQHHREV